MPKWLAVIGYTLPALELLGVLYALLMVVLCFTLSGGSVSD